MYLRTSKYTVFVYLQMHCICIFKGGKGCKEMRDEYEVEHDNDEDDDDVEYDDDGQGDDEDDDDVEDDDYDGQGGCYGGITWQPPLRQTVAGPKLLFLFSFFGQSCFYFLFGPNLFSFLF